MSSRGARTLTHQRAGRRLLGAGLAVIDEPTPVRAIQGPAAVQELAELDASYARVGIGGDGLGVCHGPLEALAKHRGSDAEWHQAGANAGTQRVSPPHRSPGSGR